MEEPTKPCTKCKEIKPLSLFSKDSRSPSGRGAQCSNCRRLAAAEWRAKDPEKTKKLLREHYAQNKDKRIANSKRWATNNPKRRKQIEAKYRDLHRDEFNLRIKNWGLANPEKKQNYSVRRRARKYSNGVYKVSDKFLKRLYAKPCFYCGKTGKIEADHILPISRGGIHSEGNLVPACRQCNAGKGNKTIMEWKVFKNS